MGKKSFNAILISLLAIGFTLPLSAQSRQSGSIYGEVSDTDGNPLPGCQITLYGPKLLGQRLYITSNTGSFFYTDLAPGGDYRSRVEMPGFKTVIRTGITVNIGNVTKIKVVMETVPLEEEVTIDEASPVVDVATSKFAVHYGTPFMASIPMNKDLYDIQNSAPGAITDDAEYRRTSSILGGTVRSALYTLDGISMNDPASFTVMANLNTDVFEEIEIGAGALPAEVGQADSVHINIVTKSGGNDFSGGITGYFTSDSLTQNLITPEEIDTLNIFKPGSYSGYKDFSLNLGGAIMADKFWFFLNGRRLVWDKINPLNPENRMADLGIDSPHIDPRHEEWLAFTKITFQIAPNIGYSGMFHYNALYEPYYTIGISADTAADAVDVWNHEKTLTTTHQISWIMNQNTFMDIRAGFVQRNFPLNAQPGTESAYTYYDSAENIYWGRSFYDDKSTLRRYLASASITWFLEKLMGAHHELKVGVEFDQAEYHQDWYRQNPWYSYWLDYADGNPYYYSDSGKQGRLRIGFGPSMPGMWDVQDSIRRLSGYIQDSLTTGRLAINLGLRFDWSYQYEPGQSRPELRYEYGPDQQNPDLGTNDLLEALIAPMHDNGLVTPFDAMTTLWKKIVEFTTFSPRIGIVYDIFGNGKTALKFHFARYYEPIWAAKYNSAQIFSPGTYNWYWNDSNENKLMDLPPIDSYELAYTTNQDPGVSAYTEDLKAPYVHEFMGGIEHELARNFKIGLHFIYKDNRNIVEDIDKNNGYDPTATDEEGRIWIPYEFTDPGMDGKFGTSDDQNLTVYGLREDRPAPEKIGTNPPETERRYYAGILTMSKRMTNNWQLDGSILYSVYKGNISAQYMAAEGRDPAFDSPNDQIYSYGRLYFDRPLQIKLMSTFILPYDFILSAYFQHRSGSTWTRTLERIYFPDDLNVKESYVWVRTEERGSNRNAAYTNMDLRLEKSFGLSASTNLSFYLDIFNVFGSKGILINDNPNGRLNYSADPPEYTLDPLYGSVSSVCGVRSFRVGLRFCF